MLSGCEWHRIVALMPWPFASRKPSPPEPPVAVLLPEPLGGQVDALMTQDREVDAIRLVRRRTEIGLLPAYRAVHHRRHTDN